MSNANPVFTGIARRPNSIATDRATMTGVGARFGGLMLVVLALAAASWRYLDGHTNQSFAFNIGAIIASLIFGIIAMTGTYGRVWAMIAYAACEGVLVGTLTRTIDTYTPGQHLASTAVLSTLCVFVAAFLGVASGIIRVGSRFATFLSFAVLGYALFGVVNLVLQLTHVVGGWGLYSLGPIGIALSALGVLLASATLVASLSRIKTQVDHGANVRYSWLFAHGLVVDVVWLYVEILRLLSVLSLND